ncbi:hypothetical protein [Paracraurococcus ruber]|uniref:DUF4412 domain-containing protein n=1 Tax=Paracraurococcus ruber TaxID=77675 RepID=A0ABS1D933_9PROT|nr:hypothetical protein [Paracraurococcus ruber]MBK1662389.1 hypothetical protein [Paracraurococcus ruber]TDG11323.1 hypothetical protein E2C05_30895 [Paracraurococcus ruber]
MRALPAGLAALALAFGLARPAAAQDRPSFQPARDVAIAYRVTAGPAAGRELRMAWLAAARKLRVDLPGEAGWTVVDQAAQRVFLVLDQQRVAVELPAGGGPGGFNLPLQPPDSARFTRAGQERVAGLPCTLWRYADGPTQGEACITADGVMLRSRGGQGERGGAVEAVAVDYAPQDAARFQPPAGYRTMQLPAGVLPPGGMPGGVPGASPGR